MEAATVAWHPLGWKPVGFAEIEPFPSAILKHHYPTIPNYNDLTKHTEWPIEPGTVNLLVGGTPCQSYSVAGKRAGLNDPRGQLMLSFLDLAERLKPRWIVWENVPGVLSSGQPKGSDFGCLLQGLVERGYGVAYRVLDAQFVGGARAVPQRRRRVFVVACLGNWKAASEVLSLREGLSGHIEKGDKKRKGTTTNVGTSPKTGGQLFDMQAIGQYGDSGVASTCKQRDYKDATDLVVPIVLDRAAFNQGENAQYEPLIEQSETCPTLVSRGPHAVQVVSPTITTCKGSKGGSSDEAIEEITAIHNAQILEPKIVKLSELRLSGKITEQETCPTLTAGAKQGDSDPLAIMPMGCDTYNGTITGDLSCTITADVGGPTHSGPKVIHQSVSDIAPTIGASGPPYSRTGNERVEAEALAITFQPGNLRRNAGADPSTTTTTTLKASSGDQVPHVAYPVDLRNATRSPDKHDAMNRQGSGLGNDGDPSPTLTKEFVPGVAQVQGVDLYNQALTGDLHCPLRTAGGHGAPAVLQSDVNITQNPVAGTLDSHYYKGPGSRQGGEREYIAAFDVFNQSVSSVNQTLSSSASDACHTGTVFSQTMAVRRLTPRECERLQGFPDDYSMIPWKGKPADQCPDGPRYKACGNSMAVPCMRFIGEQIAKVDATLANE